MPIELGIWKLGKKLERVAFSTIDSEQKLEDTLAQDISILSLEPMRLHRRKANSQGEFTDMIMVNAKLLTSTTLFTDKEISKERNCEYQ